MYALSYLIKEIEGPWGILSTIRNAFMQDKYVGVFFYKLLSCYFCIGWWSGVIIYLLSQDDLKFNLLICWGLAGAISSLILDRVYAKLIE